MHTHNIRIMISAIYAEDRKDMENISMSMKRYYKTGRKNIAYVNASLVVGFMNYFPSYLVLKIKIEFALYDDDRIAEINFYSYEIGSTSSLHLSLSFSNMFIQKNSMM